MDTLAACGDVNRNVMCTPIPFEANIHAQVDQFARDLSAHLTPATSAYHEIWLDKKVLMAIECTANKQIRTCPAVGYFIVS
jgi:sulfite reductase (NADPH) hemoprotein beta-component